MSQNDKRAIASIEETEPTVGPAIVPIFFILLLGCMVFWGLNYLDGHAGGFNPQVFEPYDSLAEVASKQPYDPAGHELAVGKAIFDKTCALCHQPNGLGKADQFPPLAGSDWILAPSPARIGRIVMKGLTGSVRVTTPRGPVSLNLTMPPPGDFVGNDEDVAAVLTYVRQQWGNNGSRIAPEQIKAIRAASAGKNGAWTQDELEKIPLTDEKAK
jgi:mono/diheme cytochrome c family protein